MSFTNPWTNFPKTGDPQTQPKQPGLESMMHPRPIFDHPDYNKGNGRLQDKVAIITGGDSGIGRAVAVAFAKEGAHVVIVHHEEHDDANETKCIIEGHNRKCLLISGDISKPEFSDAIVTETLTTFKKINILVNNAAVQYPHQNFTDMTNEKMMETFGVNIFGPI
ncbi:MAG: SDR family NAD(P)-dependent oxidoreductase, partial [Turicibacter sp.]